MVRIVVAALLTFATIGAAWAACPAGTRYQCVYMNGKAVCSCS